MQITTQLDTLNDLVTADTDAGDISFHISKLRVAAKKLEEDYEQLKEKYDNLELLHSKREAYFKNLTDNFTSIMRDMQSELSQFRSTVEAPIASIEIKQD